VIERDARATRPKPADVIEGEVVETTTSRLGTGERT
jgi:hypothetical protein